MKSLLLFLLIQQTATQGCNETFLGDSRIIESPKTINTGDPNNQKMDCFFAIQSPNSATVFLNFSEFNLKEKDRFGRCSEVLTFITKKPENSDMPQICGEQPGFTKFLTAESVIVAFSIDTEGKSFFKAKYKVCRFQFNTSIGDLSTGPFMTAENDGKLLVCQYHIMQDSSIILNVNRSKITCNGYFEMIHGNRTVFKLYGDYRRRISGIETYYFPSGFLDILLKTTCNITDAFAVYRTVLADNFSEVLQGEVGSFEPRLFHQKYANNAKYYFNITADSGGKLIISFDDIDFDFNCSDFVLMLGRNDSTRLCRENITSHAVTTTSDSVSVVFITDFYGSGKGFKGFWTTCGGLYTDSVGEIWSPKHDFSPQNTSYEAECDYTLHVTGAERIYVLLNASQNNLHPMSAAEKTGNKTYTVNGDALALVYNFVPDDDFNFLYLACPIVFTNQSGTMAFDERILQAIAPGQNCTFEIRSERGNMTTIDMLFKNGLGNSAKNCIGDYIQFQFYTSKTTLETAVFCGLESMRTLNSWGSAWITYFAVDHSTLQFNAQYKIEKVNGSDTVDIPNSDSSLQTTNGFWKNFIKSELFISMLAAAVGLITLLVIVGAIVNYRRKKKAVQETAWLTDMAASTPDRSSKPCLPDANNTNDSASKKRERIIGLGEYAEVVLPNDNRYQERLTVNEDHRRYEVLTFSPHSKSVGSTIPVSSLMESEEASEVIKRAEYSTPWDAKKERDKIVRVMSAECSTERKSNLKEVEDSHRDGKNTSRSEFLVVTKLLKKGKASSKDIENA